jgi:hypothetical protein
MRNKLTSPVVQCELIVGTFFLMIICSKRLDAQPQFEFRQNLSESRSQAMGRELFGNWRMDYGSVGGSLGQFRVVWETALTNSWERWYHRGIPRVCFDRCAVMCFPSHMLPVLLFQGRGYLSFCSIAGGLKVRLSSFLSLRPASRQKWESTWTTGESLNLTPSIYLISPSILSCSPSATIHASIISVELESTVGRGETKRA